MATSIQQEAAGPGTVDQYLASQADKKTGIGVGNLLKQGYTMEEIAAQALGGSTSTYLRNLRVLQRGLTAMASGAINPTTQQAIADIINRAGLGSDELGKALAGGALTIMPLEAQAIAGGIAPELSELQAAADIAKAGVPRASSDTSAVLGGAAAGFAVGGPWGAAAGAVGGAIGNRGAKQSQQASRARAEKAAALASPEHYLETANLLMSTAREQTFVESERAQLAAESAISRTGLRGTGIGTQASLGAAVSPAIAALRKAGVGAGNIVRRDVESTLGTPIRTPSDNLSRVVTAGAMMAGSLLTPERLAAMKAKKTRAAAEQIDPFLPNGGISQGVFDA